MIIKYFLFKDFFIWKIILIFLLTGFFYYSNQFLAGTFFFLISIIVFTLIHIKKIITIKDIKDIERKIDELTML